MRYSTSATFTPHVRINARIEGREAGASADIANNGAPLIYLSPGATPRLARQAQNFIFECITGSPTYRPCQ